MIMMAAQLSRLSCALAVNVRRLPVHFNISCRTRLFSTAPVNHYKHSPTPKDPISPVHPDDLPFISADDRKVSIGWTTRTWSRFHNIWLRDHCRCSSCFHPITKQRLLNTFTISPKIKPMTAQAVPEGLEIVWSESIPHKSLYPWLWLQTMSYDPKFPESNRITEKILWGSKIQQRPPTVTYDEAMSQDQYGLYQWLKKIDQFGFCFVSGVPTSSEATEELSQRIGFIRETQYGKFWDFTSDLARGDTAYTTLALGAHTDNTYFTDPCGLQLFHLLSHTDGSGGSTLLVDGFYIATILKQLHPDAYALLSRLPVPAHAAGDEMSFYCQSPPNGYPVLQHDLISGELTTVRWNNDDRSAMSPDDPDIVDQWYDAIRIWNRFITSPGSEYWVQLTPGNAVVVDNHRVLHGRSSFTGRRRMCGAYIGVDEYRSKLTVLSEKFKDGPQPATSPINRRNIWHPAL